MRLTLILSLFAALGVYVVMVTWSLPLISAEAAGQRPFDMRPMGYSLAEARTFLAALSTAGRQHYLTTQHLLDSIYPALLGLTLVLGFFVLFRSRLKWLGALLSVAAMAADYRENTLVAGLLRAGPDGVTADMVAEAALMTQAKSAATSVVFLALILRLAWAMVQRRR